MKVENLANRASEGDPVVPVDTPHDPQHANSTLHVHYLHELPFADEQRLEELFKKLDKDENGKIDIHDLSGALKDLGLSHQYAEVTIRKEEVSQCV